MSDGDSGFTMGQLAELVPGAELVGDPDCRVSALVHPLEVGSSEQLCLMMSPALLPFLEAGKIRCAVTGTDLHEEHGDKLAGLAAYIYLDRPRYALGTISRLFPRLRRPAAGVHASAVVEEGAEVHPSASVGPFCVVRSGAVVGKDCWLREHVSIGEGAVLGAGCLAHGGVRIGDGVEIGERCIFNQNAVVGGDGFSFVTPERGSAEAARGGEHGAVQNKNTSIERIESLGTVRIGDDVEIGANTCVDRATLGATVIGSGTKIDNLCQIAHNVEIGENCLLASQNGVAGSAKLGDRVVAGGQAGFADHVSVGDDAVLMSRSGVTVDLEGGKVYAGMHAMPARQMLKFYALRGRLAEMWRDLNALKKDRAG